MDQSITPQPDQTPSLDKSQLDQIPAPAGKVNGMAVASLVTSLAPLVLVWIKNINCITPILPVGAIVLGAIGLGQIKRSNGTQTGKKLASAGITIGSIYILLGIILLVLAIFGIAAIANLIRQWIPSLNSIGY